MPIHYSEETGGIVSRISELEDELRRQVSRDWADMVRAMAEEVLFERGSGMTREEHIDLVTERVRYAAAHASRIDQPNSGGGFNAVNLIAQVKQRQATEVLVQCESRRSPVPDIVDEVRAGL